jgi:hypothetical protein
MYHQLASKELVPSNQEGPSPSISTVESGKVLYGQAWMRAAIQSRRTADHTKTSPCDELKRYLDAPVEEVDNIVLWWGVCLLQFLL